MALTMAKIQKKRALKQPVNRSILSTSVSPVREFLVAVDDTSAYGCQQIICQLPSSALIFGLSILTAPLANCQDLQNALTWKDMYWVDNRPKKHDHRLAG